MKIVYFSPYFYPYLSGTTTYPQKLLTELAKKHEVTVLTFRYQDDLRPKEKAFGLEIVRMPFQFRISKGFVSFNSLKWFYTELKSAEAVMINLPSAEGLPLALMAKIKRISIVAIYHCEVILGPGFVRGIISHGLKLAVRWQLDLSSRITGYTKDYLKSRRVWQRYQRKIELVLPPVERPHVNRQQCLKWQQEKKEEIWIGYAGRVSREKGLHILVRAVRQLKLKDKVRLVFAGPYGEAVSGEADYYNEVKKELNKAGIKHTFFGSLKGGDLGAFYQSIDVLLLPSINQTEAFGMVQVEAMKLGTPVVAAELPGVRVPVKETGMGMTVPPGKVKLLTEALMKVLKNRQEYTNQEKLKLAVAYCEPKETFKAYERIIDELKG